MESPITGRRRPMKPPKEPAKGAEALEAEREANVGNRLIRLDEELARHLHPPARLILAGRLAKQLLELP